MLGSRWRVSPHMLPWVVAGAALMLCALTATWILADQWLLSSSDSDMHHISSQVYARIMKLGDLHDLLDWLTYTNVSWPSLPLLYHGALGWLISDSPDAIRFYSLPLLLLIIWCIYQLGVRLGDRSTGALAAVIAGFSLGLTSHARHVSLDLPATLAVSLALLALVKVQRRRRLWPQLIFGAACGVAFLTRVQALFFLFFPALLVYGLRLWRTPSWLSRGRLLFSLGSAMAVMVFITSFHWYGRLTELISVATSHVDSSMVYSLGDPHFLPGLVYFVVALGQVAGWPVLGMALLTAPLLVRHNRRAAALLPPLVMGGLLLYAATVSREERYILPALPALCLMAALGLRHLSARLKRPAGVILLVGAVLPSLLMAEPSLAMRGAKAWAPIFPGILRPPMDLCSSYRRRMVGWVVYTVERATAGPDQNRVFLLLDGVDDARLVSNVIYRLPGRPVLASLNDEAIHSQFVRRRASTHRMVLLSDQKRPVGRGKGKHLSTFRIGDGGREIIPKGDLHLYLFPVGWDHRLRDRLFPRALGK